MALRSRCGLRGDSAGILEQLHDMDIVPKDATDGQLRILGAMIEMATQMFSQAIVDFSDTRFLEAMRQAGMQLGLQEKFQVPVDRVGVPGGSRHQVTSVAQFGGHAVVENQAVFAEHDAVAAHAGFEAGEIIRIQHFDKPERVGALDFELSERRAVVVDRDR